MVDTGASLVLLRFNDATRIWIDLQGLDFLVPLTAANRKSNGAPMIIEQLTIGDISLQNVRAAVA